jgi:hypothetical protein
MKKILLVLLLVLFGLSTVAVQGQVKSGSVGLGLQVGDPSGLTLKFYNGGKASVDILAAWDLNDYLFVNVHALYHKPLGGARNVNFFYGPGAFISFYERGRYEDYIGAGISGNFGLNVFFDRFELFAQITPRLQVLEFTDGDLGGGVGLRFYF